MHPLFLETGMNRATHGVAPTLWYDDKFSGAMV